MKLAERLVELVIRVGGDLVCVLSGIAAGVLVAAMTGSFWLGLVVTLSTTMALS